MVQDLETPVSGQVCGASRALSSSSGLAELEHLHVESNSERNSCLPLGLWNSQ